MDNKKDTKPFLNKQDIQRLKMVYYTDPNFGTKQSNKLFSALNNKYPNRGTLSVVCYSLKKFFEDKGNKTKSDFWGAKGGELAQDVQKQEKKGELTNNEKENWKTQEELLEIMNGIKINDITDYNRFLLLAMTLFQPPLRKAFYTDLKFLFNKKNNDGKYNYLLLQKKPKKSYYIVNNDKVSKYEKFNDENSMYIEIINPDLVQLLWNSYNQKKRDYIFESSGGKPYSINSISIILLERPFNLNFNILRSSYVSKFYKDNIYPQEREELARKMRHSPNVAALSYLKRI